MKKMIPERVKQKKVKFPSVPYNQLVKQDIKKYDSNAILKLVPRARDQTDETRQNTDARQRNFPYFIY